MSLAHLSCLLPVIFLLRSGYFLGMTLFEFMRYKGLSSLLITLFFLHWSLPVTWTYQSYIVQYVVLGVGDDVGHISQVSQGS